MQQAIVQRDGRAEMVEKFWFLSGKQEGNNAMIGLLITLLVLCLIAGIVWWALQQIPLPPPARMIVVVIFALILVLVLLQLLPVGPFNFHRWR